MLAYIASIALIIVHMVEYETSDAWVILALIGYVLNGSIPSCGKRADIVLFGVSLKTFLHIAAGLLSTVCINTYLGKLVEENARTFMVRHIERINYISIPLHF